MAANEAHNSFVSSAFAYHSQGANPTTMTDKLCDQRGKIYVMDKNKDESVPEPGRSFYWSFVAAHYDSRTNSCYVMYDRFVSGLGTVLEQLKIDDSEGNRVAGFSSIWTSNRNGRPAYSKPSECEVNGTNLSKSLMNCLGSSFQHSNKLRHVGLYTAEPSIRQEGSRIRFRRRGWSTPGEPYRKLEIHFSDFGDLAAGLKG